MVKVHPLKTYGKNDLVQSPAHYVEGRSIEPLEVILDWKLDYLLGNIVKYIARFERKNNPIQDLEKAKFYLETKISLLKKGASANE